MVCLWFVCFVSVSLYVLVACDVCFLCVLFVFFGGLWLFVVLCFALFCRAVFLLFRLCSWQCLFFVAVVVGVVVVVLCVCAVFLCGCCFIVVVLLVFVSSSCSVFV